MKHSAEMRRCLEDGDVQGVRKLWAHLSPHLPQPVSDLDALKVMHMARTHAASVKFRLRAYSHHWLTEHGLPSGLPDHLRPRAERMYPRIVDAVGIAVKSRLPDLRLELETAMSAAVMEAYADNRKDPSFVKARMMEARERVLKSN